MSTGFSCHQILVKKGSLVLLPVLHVAPNYFSTNPLSTGYGRFTAFWFIPSTVYAPLTSLQDIAIQFTMASSNDNDEFSCSAHEFGDDVLVAVAAWWCSAASYTIAYLSAVAIEANRNKVAHNHDNSEDDDDKSPVVTKRIRRPISTIFDELGTYYQRRAYRMDAESFYELHCILYPYLKPKEIRNASGSKPKQRNGAPNGLIPSTTRLAAALRFFAGASPYELAVCHGISVKEVYRSVNRVIDGIHRSSVLDINFPTDHDDQEKLAEGFKDICPMWLSTSNRYEDN